MEPIGEWLTRCYVWLTLPRERDDRGDVPGWVLITVMTAMLVGVIYAVARDQLRELVRDALQKVS
jgi:hypothetical protein